jgi:hypothetical protein
MEWNLCTVSKEKRNAEQISDTFADCIETLAYEARMLYTEVESCNPFVVKLPKEWQSKIDIVRESLGTTDDCRSDIMKGLFSEFESLYKELI